jgi:hypothetical protein
MRILRRLFVVPLANNDHGKTHIMNALLSQGLGRRSPGQKGRRSLRSPWGRRINSLVFVRSYQETEKNSYGGVVAALEAEDGAWMRRELVIMPSHLDVEDVGEMIDTAHGNGFDAVAASVILNNREREDYAQCWRQPWDERWNVPNPLTQEDWEEQVEGLGRDLWTWICQALSR